MDSLLSYCLSHKDLMHISKSFVLKLPKKSYWMVNFIAIIIQWYRTLTFWVQDLCIQPISTHYCSVSLLNQNWHQQVQRNQSQHALYLTCLMSLMIIPRQFIYLASCFYCIWLLLFRLIYEDMLFYDVLCNHLSVWMLHIPLFPNKISNISQLSTIKIPICMNYYYQVKQVSLNVYFGCLLPVCYFITIYYLNTKSFAHLQLIFRKRVMSRRNHNQPYDSQDEAEQVQEEVEIDQGPMNNSEQSGEDLLQDAERDYERLSQFDRYEPQSADRQHFDLNPEARRLAQKELNKRDKKQEEQDFIDQYIEEDYQGQVDRKRAYYQQQDQRQDQQDDDQFIDAQQCRGKLHQWISLEKTKKFIKKRFLRFLNEFSIDKTQRIYYRKVMDMLNENRQSIEISYEHFKNANATLAIWLGIEPLYLLPQLNAILYSFLCKKSPSFKNIIQEVYVKFYQMPVYDRIRELRVDHIGKLINFKGVVTVRGEVLSQLKKTFYKCYRCGELRGPYFITDRSQVNLGNCRSCQSSGPFLMQKGQCVYRNHQRIVMQQSHSDVDAGRIPRTKQVILIGDNVDSLKPGEQAQIVGIYTSRYECYLNVKQGFPVFTTYVEANSIVKLNQINLFSSVQESQFHSFAKRPNLDQIIYDSIAPSIYGHMEVKQAIAFALFGGTQKYDQQKMHRTRGDINLLLLGDPGIAKSQFLKSIQRVFHRCVYATGKGASAVGLTASVKQDAQTGEWKLQAGAMVQADRGICLIDQFDKMNDHDRTSIHEAMQQQTISISKAGIVTQLKARCSVIAAANPLQGRYNQTISFADNVSLSDPILSRFDIIKVMKDRPNEEIDSNLSIFVINSHMKNHPYNIEYEQEISQLKSYERPREVAEPEFLKQYIKYVRQKFKNTRINDKCSQLIQQFYAKLRKSSAQSGGIVITPRSLQSMIRICQAHAKMNLRQEPIRQDAQIAIRTMLKSYIETQKHGPGSKIAREFQMFG